MSDWTVHPWMDQARCAQIGGDKWFPEWGGNERDPKAVCESCDVRQQCLDYAIKHRINDGIWGGVSERQRRRIITKRNMEARLRLEAS